MRRRVLSALALSAGVSAAAAAAGFQVGAPAGSQRGKLGSGEIWVGARLGIPVLGEGREWDTRRGGGM